VGEGEALAVHELYAILDLGLAGDAIVCWLPLGSEMPARRLSNDRVSDGLPIESFVLERNASALHIRRRLVFDLQDQTWPREGRL
jgi:hypothetical protein